MIIRALIVNTSILVAFPGTTGEDISLDYEAVFVQFKGEKKGIASALTLIGYTAGDIALITKPITRSRSKGFRADYYDFLTSNGTKTDAEAEAFVKGYDGVTANVIAHLKDYVRDANLTSQARANERAIVKAEYEATKVKPSKK